MEQSVPFLSRKREQGMSKQQRKEARIRSLVTSKSKAELRQERAQNNGSAALGSAPQAQSFT